MSPKEKIAKLESLLTRVKERAEAPRPNFAAAFAAEPATFVQPAQPLTPPTPEPPRVVEASRPPSHSPGATPSVPPMDLMSGWSEPPPPTSADPVLETADLADITDYESDMEVDVSAEVVEVDIDIEEPAAHPSALPSMSGPAVTPAESGAQPVAEHISAHPSAEVEIGAAELETHELEGEAHELEVEGEAHELEVEGKAHEAHEAEVQDSTLVAAGQEMPPPPAEAPPANEVIEPEPSSSPRPIAPPEVETHYEEESAPRHTPPPESGKQVAAASVKPEARKSAAPPSLEGHTLIGGWRNGEPVIGTPRETPRAEETTQAEPPRVPSVRPPPPAPPPAPVRLAAETTKPELPEIAQVAVIEGNVPEFAPKNFGDLLDASLSL